MASADKFTVPLLLCLAAFFISSCGTTARIDKRGPRSTVGGGGTAIENGVASWYGPNFHGKLTANGEVYDMYKLTAAHRTLPFNTRVRVQNLDNDKSVVVRINDRGPFAKNRVIDLSKKAATEIDMLGPGTARVRLYIVEGDVGKAQSSNLKVATYTVQLGSFQEEERAIQKSREIKGSRIEKVYLSSGKAVYRIYYGTYTDKEEADMAYDRLQSEGYSGYVKQLEN